MTKEEIIKASEDLLDVAEKYLSHEDRCVRDLALYVHSSLIRRLDRIEALNINGLEELLGEENSHLNFGG